MIVLACSRIVFIVLAIVSCTKKRLAGVALSSFLCYIEKWSLETNNWTVIHPPQLLYWVDCRQQQGKAAYPLSLHPADVVVVVSPRRNENNRPWLCQSRIRLSVPPFFFTLTRCIHVVNQPPPSLSSFFLSPWMMIEVLSNAKQQPTYSHTQSMRGVAASVSRWKWNTAVYCAVLHCMSICLWFRHWWPTAKTPPIY